MAARTKALRVFAFTGAVFPGEWTSVYSEVVIIDLVEFAFHARRVNEISGLKAHDFPSIKTLTFVISSGDPGGWISNYQWALDRIMHARKFVFGNVHADHRRLFTNAESNLIPAYVKVETDKQEMVTISLFGLVECFLNSVLPELRKRHPDWLF